MKFISKAAVLASIMAFAVVLMGQAVPANAGPTALTVNGVATTPQAIGIGVTVPVVATYNDEGSATLVLTSSNPAVAFFNTLGATVTPANGETIAPANTLAGVVTVTDDADAVVAAKTLTVNLFCAVNGTTNISYTQGLGTSTTIVVNCGTGAGTTTVTFSANPATIGIATNVTVACTAGQALTTVPTTSGAFGAAATNGTYNSASQVTCLAAGSMVATYSCSIAGTVTFYLAGIALTPALTCGATTTGGLTATSINGYSATVTGTCTAGALLTQTGAAGFTAATINGVAVAVTPGSISCTTAGTIIATLTCTSTQVSGTVYLALGAANTTFACGTGYGYGGGYNPYLNNYPTNNCNTGAYPYNGYTTNGAYPYNTGVYNQYNTGVYNQYNTGYNTNCGYNQQVTNTVPSSLTITAPSTSVTCGGTSSITVRVMAANGQTVSDGTPVTLAASVGTLSPVSGTTVAGAVTATYTAPANVPATSVTLRATAGSASNTTGVSVSCATTTTTTAAAPVLPPSYSPPAPPAGPLVISPPNTGSAGLKALEVICDD